MTLSRHAQQTLALAGIAQAAFLVNQLGQHGLAAQDKLETLLNSLFVINPNSTEAVYGKISKLNLGLQLLQEILQGQSNLLKNPNIIAYIFGLLHLEKKLAKNKAMLALIGTELLAIQSRHPELDDTAHYLTTPQLIEELAELYQRTISTLPFRIQVKGNMNFLKNEQTAKKIRAVLLAGIRSAVLWQQLGGKRWHLLFYRKRVAKDVSLLLSNIY
ncbi:high frequency lysogenization protein HflD [Gammaproteobacteria bacterium]|nr:high frequency lysogenization protein HflD [Gammaproteobacteria bacterium]